MNELSVYESKSNIVPLLDNKKIELLKNTICKGSTDDEFQLFMHACNRTGLDPFMKQIYAVKRWDSNLKRESMTIQTGIDGYRLIAERTGKYSPGKEPTYQYDDKGNIISSTAYIKKQTADGTWHEIAATAFFNEYCQKTKEGRPTKFWMQLGHAMIAKCAEALALRKAFPGDLSGIYTKEEMQQADIEVVETNLDHKKVDTKMMEINSQSHQDHIVDYNDMIETITKDDWKNLKILITRCPKSFQDKTWKRLESLEWNDDSFNKMTKQEYSKIKLACEGSLAKQEREKNEANKTQTEI